MPTPPQHVPPVERPRLVRRLRTLAAIVLLTALTLEAGAWALLAFLDLENDAAVSLEGVDLTTEARVPEAPEQRLFQTTMLHPFLGHVRDPGEPLQGFDPISSQFGFPQREHLFWEPADDRLIVAVLGGLVARWLGIRKDMLRDALAAVPRFRNRRVEVVVLAAGAYRQPQQLLALQYFLALGAHFDVVLNVDGFNDFVFPAQRYEPGGMYSFYPQGWDRRVAEFDLVTRRHVGELAYLRERRAASATWFATTHWNRSPFVRLIGHAVDLHWQNLLAAAFEAAPEKNSKRRDFQSLGPRLVYADEEALHRELVAVWRRSSRALHELCRVRDIEYHHVLQPNQYVPGGKILSAEELQIAYHADHPHREEVVTGYPLLRAAGEELRRAGVSFHDLSTVFRDRSDTLYRDTCCHLNDIGDLGLAQAVADRVDTEVSLPAALAWPAARRTLAPR